MPVRCVDLFSGIGGFHATATALGWSTTYACDIDSRSNAVYEANWGVRPRLDIQEEASETTMRVPRHDVLFAGFPCQPFSKSGAQRGMDEARGTLFWNIARILEARRPSLVVLENVRNLWGPRHRHEWDVIVATLRELGYRVSDEPLVTSPHRIHPDFGGRPQTRERVYINATYVPPRLRSRFPLKAPRLDLHRVSAGWNPRQWDLLTELKSVRRSGHPDGQPATYSEDEKLWVDTWDKLVKALKARELRIPGLPLWADVWTGDLVADDDMPQWKQDFISGNLLFYEVAATLIDSWLRDNPQFHTFPASRRKLEWQAGDVPSLWKCLLQFRPSGVRAKRPDYIPAAVAITQTSLVGPLRRRLSVHELAHMQGLPSWFDFRSQPDTASYRQLGNGIAVASAFHSVLAHLERDKELITAMKRADLLEPLTSGIKSPDSPLEQEVR